MPSRSGTKKKNLFCWVWNERWSLLLLLQPLNWRQYCQFICILFVVIVIVGCVGVHVALQIHSNILYWIYNLCGCSELPPHLFIFVHARPRICRCGSGSRCQGVDSRSTGVCFLTKHYQTIMRACVRYSWLALCVKKEQRCLSWYTNTQFV